MTFKEESKLRVVYKKMNVTKKLSIVCVFFNDFRFANIAACAWVQNSTRKCEIYAIF